MKNSRRLIVLSVSLVAALFTGAAAVTGRVQVSGGNHLAAQNLPENGMRGLGGVN